MDTPGAMLKSARRVKGFTLDELAHITRIPRSTLGLLELDYYEELPAEVFVRGFLRNIARELDINPERIILAYETHTGRVHASALDQVQPVQEHTDSALPNLRAVDRIKAPEPEGMSWWDNVVDTVGSTRPAYIFATLFVVLGIALGASVVFTSTTSAPLDLSPKANWNVGPSGPKARWIRSGQSNLVGTANVDAPSARDADSASGKPADKANTGDAGTKKTRSAP